MQKKNTENRAFKVEKVFLSSRGTAFFNLNINDVTIYGCRVVECKTGDFISFPKRKGTDGKYYNHAYIKLTDDEMKAIIAEVEKEVNS